MSDLTPTKKQILAGIKIFNSMFLNCSRYNQEQINIIIKFGKQLLKIGSAYTDSETFHIEVLSVQYCIDILEKEEQKCS